MSAKPNDSNKDVKVENPQNPNMDDENKQPQPGKDEKQGGTQVIPTANNVGEPPGAAETNSNGEHLNKSEQACGCGMKGNHTHEEVTIDKKFFIDLATSFKSLADKFDQFATQTNQKFEVITKSMPQQQIPAQQQLLNNIAALANPQQAPAQAMQQTAIPPQQPANQTTNTIVSLGHTTPIPGVVDIKAGVGLEPSIKVPNWKDIMNKDIQKRMQFHKNPIGH